MLMNESRSVWEHKTFGIIAVNYSRYITTVIKPDVALRNIKKLLTI